MRWIVCEPEEWYRTHPERMVDVRAFYRLLRRVLLTRGHEVVASDVIHGVPDGMGTWDVCLTHHGHGHGEQGVWHVKKGYLPGHLYVDRCGYGPLAEASYFEPPWHASGFMLARAQAFIGALDLSNVSKWPQPPRRESPTGRYVFVPLQVRTDTTQEFAHMSQIDMLRTVAEALRGSGVRVLAKRHPFDQEFPDLGSAVEWVDDWSIHDLLKNAEAVVTVNSGVGFEALLWRRPVITCGVSDYAWAVLEAKDAPSLERLVYEVLAGQHDGMRNEAFAYAAWFLREYLVPLDEEDITRRVATIEMEAAL